MGSPLAPSRAKLRRARTHAETYKSEVAGLFNGDGAYEDFLNVDPETGVGALGLRFRGDFSEVPLIVGDCVHNLRAALDYIIVALVDAQGITLTRDHGFPIYATEDGYTRRVGVVGSPKKGGPLGGLQVGDSLVYEVQPFRNPYGYAADSLWYLHRLSNADKHRQVAVLNQAVHQGSLVFRPRGQKLLSFAPVAPNFGQPENSTIIARVVLALPISELTGYDISSEGLGLRMEFVCPAFDSEAKIAVDGGEMRYMCDRVEEIIDKFEAVL